MNAKEGRDWEPCLIHHTPTLFLMKRQPLPHPHPSCHPFCFSPCLGIFQNVEERQQGWGEGSLTIHGACYSTSLVSSTISVLHTIYLKNQTQGWRDDSVGRAFSMQMGRSASGPPAHTHTEKPGV